MKRTRAVRRSPTCPAAPALFLLLALLPGGACRTAPPATPHPEPSWRVRQGQAVWKPNRRASEVPGEITVATGGPGQFLVEFSKPALPLVRVVRQGDAWQVSAPGRGQHAGIGRPPTRSWFQLGALLSGEPMSPPWRGERHSDGSEWWLENARTGERIEGYLAP